MTNFNYYKLGGSLEYQHPTYVVRQADYDLYEGLKNGELCYVLNSRQMGKSSLRVNIMKRLKEQNIKCASVDLTRIGGHVNPSEWYGGFVSELLRGFGLSRKINFGNWWRSRDFLPPKQRLCEFIDDVLLPEFSGKIIIFVDEIDSILQISFKDDFFTFIRACYNQRADNPEYQRLTFCLLGVATPSSLIADKNLTPFNIGRAIELNGFKLDEVESLARGLNGQIPRPKKILEEVLKWTGGQPFLTQKLCQIIYTTVSEAWTEMPEGQYIERLVKAQIIENWEAQDEPEHLRTIRDRLTQNPENQTGRLLGLYQQILQQGEIPANDSPEQTQLRLTGLVVKEQGKLRIYNYIYGEIFNQHWLDQTLANIRPYGQALNTWVASNFQDESRLLRGKTLQDARIWSENKGLSDLDRRFLDASQELEKRDVQKRLEAEAEVTRILTEANQVLTIANQKAKRRIQIGGGVLGITLITSLFTGLLIWRMVKQAQLEKIKSSTIFSTALFVSDKKLDALLQALKAGKEVKNTYGVDKAIQAQVLEILQHTVNFTREHNRLEQHNGAIRGVVFSPDGKFLATVGEDKHINIWSYNGKLLKTLTPQESGIIALSFNPNGNLLATVDETGLIKIWNWKDGILLETIKQEGSVWLASLNFSHDGLNLATSNDKNGKISIWSKNQNWKLIRTIEDSQNKVLHVSYSPAINSKNSPNNSPKNSPNNSLDKNLLASANSDGTIKIWQPSNGKLIQTIKAHNKAVLYLTFSRDGKFLATASEDTTVKIWKTNDWQLVKTIKSHDDWVNAISFSPDGKYLVSASDDNKVKIWRTHDSRLIEALEGHNNKVYSVSFSPDGKTLASAGEDKKVILWGLNDKLLKIITDHNDVIKKMIISPDRKILATASNDKTIKLWDSHNGELLKTLQHTEKVEGISFTPNNKSLYSASINGIIKNWRIQDGKLIHQWKEVDSLGMFEITLSPDGKTLASSGGDKVIKIWDTNSRKLITTLEGHKDRVFNTNFSPKVNMLASASKDGTIKLWEKSQDSKNWQLQKTLSQDKSPILDVIFSPDGKLIASGSLDGKINLWQTDNGALIKSLIAHQGQILSVNISPNGQLLASAGEDGVIKIWEISNGDLLYSLQGHKSAVRNVIFLNNQTLASVSAGLEETVILWDLENMKLDRLLEYGCSLIYDYLKNNSKVKSEDRFICD